MSDPEVPQNEQPSDVDDVLGSANEGLDAAAAARDNVPGVESVENAADPDVDAFAAAERDFPGTFAAPASSDEKTPDAADAASASTASAPEAEHTDQHDLPRDADEAAGDRGATEPAAAASDSSASDTTSSDATAFDRESFAAAKQTSSPDADARAAFATPALNTQLHQTDTADAPTEQYAAQAGDAETVQYTPPSVADTAYGAAAMSPAAETRILPAEPTAPAAPQPIFVQAPEPPRELGNRGAAGGIGIVAAICFAILYMGAILGFGALNGDVTLENVGTEALATVQTFSFWVPVVVFFLAFWLLGAFINRARWGKWVVLGLLVAAATYGGHLLGQLFQAPFWSINASQASELVNEQLLAPLAIAAFVFARELTIWFGAWVSRSGAKKKALNAEAQAEYERTLEAGPAAMHGA